ncbi:MAG: helix-turn-helix transcriptional regulator [Pseudomonadota bacterium]
MANLTSLLRDEITRLARRQINAEIVPLKKRWAQQRRVIASLKEECSALRRELTQLSKHAAVASPAAGPRPAQEGGTRRRFRADGLRSFRVRLGLTVREVALLLGVSEQTIYNWETASTRPQPAMLDTIAELRALGKRQVKARLLELQEAK